MNRKVVFCLSLFILVLLIPGCASSPPVTISVSPTSATLFSTQSVQLTATDSDGNSDVDWTVPGNSGAAVDAMGNFTAPSVTQITTITVTATSHHDSSKFSTAAITVLPPGQVTATINPQVALYTLNLPPGTSAYIEFSTDTSYNLKTWTQPAPATGPLTFFVAGMLASTQYHMRAVLPGANGAAVNDLDHTFSTQAVPAVQVPALTTTTTPGMTPQPGVEILDLLNAPNGTAPLAAFDLSGNMVWSIPPITGAQVEGPHLLPDGNFLFVAAPGSVEEIDLTGTVIRKETLAQLQTWLNNQGINYTANQFHHDVIALPNGHWIALFNVNEPCTAIPNCSGLGTILGDVLVDLAPQSDGSFLPVWYWSTFDHLDINRAPLGLPDWTHSNAILYSADDGNLLLSIRHQSWIIKIDYENGKGTGDILWHLGSFGDFALKGGTDPWDWFYMQHGPSFTTTNSTGQFGLAVFDNGDNRPQGNPNPPACFIPTCLYSRGVNFQLDETAKTATIITDYRPNEYVFWGGNAEQLANGNLEADFNVGNSSGFSDIFEVTPGSNPQVVWRLSTSAAAAYRGFRLPSLYPGVQW